MRRSHFTAYRMSLVKWNLFLLNSVLAFCQRSNFLINHNLGLKWWDRIWPNDKTFYILHSTSYIRTILFCFDNSEMLCDCHVMCGLPWAAIGGKLRINIGHGRGAGDTRMLSVQKWWCSGVHWCLPTVRLWKCDIILTIYFNCNSTKISVPKVDKFNF